MQRRSFLTLLGGAAAAWPLAARAQQDGRVRRVGVLIGGTDNDPQMLSRVATLRETLSRLGWIESRNLQTIIRFGLGDSEQTRTGAAELVSLTPDVILVSSTPAAKAVRQQSQTVPIIFTTINDPVTTGLVGNLARPENNSTGFALYEPSIAGKWIALLKEAAPHVARLAHVFDPANAPETYFAPIEAAAHALAMQAVKMPVRDAIDIVRGIDNFAREPNGALLLPPDNTTVTHRETINRLAVQHRLPTIYSGIYIAREGGLMGYGTDVVDEFRRAATYVDRILRGAKPTELPVQFPTKFELVVNLKTAKAIGLTISEAFLLRADELIE